MLDFSPWITHEEKNEPSALDLGLEVLPVQSCRPWPRTAPASSPSEGSDRREGFRSRQVREVHLAAGGGPPQNIGAVVTLEGSAG